ncbi:uncharacterized protein [Palaemon carinicauda]|uniref:uncharacterized protein n=1 Tax=Palaemon carinicauda TaxID=392227 RepID=UPI0035B57D3C
MWELRWACIYKSWEFLRTSQLDLAGPSELTMCVRQTEDTVSTEDDYEVATESSEVVISEVVALEVDPSEVIGFEEVTLSAVTTTLQVIPFEVAHLDNMTLGSHFSVSVVEM